MFRYMKRKRKRRFCFGVSVELKLIEIKNLIICCNDYNMLIIFLLLSLLYPKFPARCPALTCR